MDKYEQRKELELAINIGIKCIQRQRVRMNNQDEPDERMIHQLDKAVRVLQRFTEAGK
jgi:hypothetical protein